MTRAALVAASIWAAGSWTGSSAPHAQAPAVPAAQQAGASGSGALVGQYCVTCHNQRLKTGGLALDSLDASNLHRDAEVWEKVIRKVRGNMMPPAGSPRPAAATLDAFVGGLEKTLDSAAATRPRPGRTRPHRFNRAEYANAIRDLLSLESTPRPCCRPTIRATDSTTSPTSSGCRRCSWSGT